MTSVSPVFKVFANCQLLTAVIESMPHDLPKSYEPGAIETRWADYWIKEKLFSVPTPPPGETRPVFTLLLPPPNVTGRLHMGHMLNQTQMDIIVRWHRMRGFITLWLPGTDHAGIATQMMVERDLAKEGRKRRDLGREKFIERVWEWKKLYGGAILDQMKRLGASVDWDREYFTMDENLSRAVREVFVRLYEEGLIYRGKYIVNWCPRCETAISDLEVKHEEVAGKLWEIRYPVIGTDEFITVATTRPETMLGDTAIAVNAKDERYTHLHGKKVLLPLMNREIPIIIDELAQPEFGTGAVKVTPAHDPNDFKAGQRHNLPQIDIMDEHAHMNQNAGRFNGLDRYEARKRILADLQEQGFLVAEKDYALSLGKCDRCGTVVEPRLSEQWFIKIQPLAQKAIEAVESGEITIVPGKLQTDLSQLDEQHLRLVHLAPVVVGPSHSRMDLRPLQTRGRGSRRTSHLPQVRQHKIRAGFRRARYLVFLRPFTVHHTRLAREDARSGSVLSHNASDHRLRDFIFLGSAHDHVRLPLHARPRTGSFDQESQRLGRQEE